MAEATAAATEVFPVVVDYFADHDCQQTASHFLQIPTWGDQLAVDCHQPGADSLASLIRQPETSKRRLAEIIFHLENLAGHDANVLLAGGTENWPELVGLLHERFRVLGPTCEQLEQLRSHGFWRQLAKHAELCFPETRNPLADSQLAAGSWSASSQFATEVPDGELQTHLASGAWLSKPYRGGGGLGVRRENALDQGASAPTERTRYWQREIHGRGLGAHCVLFEDRSILLGVTESFAADDWPGPSEFIYRGSWGPVSIQAEQEKRIINLCNAVREATGLRGWLQMDFVEDAARELWLLELNPRWAAGMEVLHRTGINPVDFHLAAWKQRPLPHESQVPASRFAKGVVYAEQDLLLTPQRLARLHQLPTANFADIPSAAMVHRIIAAGHPLLTVRITRRQNVDKSALLNELRRLARRCLA